MYLADTNVFSELRRGRKGNPGVTDFFMRSAQDTFMPVQALGEMRQGIENLKHRGDFPQARRLEEWFFSVLRTFGQRILDFDARSAQVWGALMSANNQHPVDKQIAAIALVYDLTVVTRNTDDFEGTGVPLLNPFSANAPAARPAQESN